MAEVKTDEVKVTKTPAKDKGLVEIRIPRGELGADNYIIVGDNGKYYKLKRGEVVKVPQSVADIIESSMENEEKARDFLESLTNK